jgi:adenylate kinase family enzyme
VAVIGNGGGGKTVLSRAISELRQLPVHEVDQIQWQQPGWVAVPEKAVRERLETVLDQPRWIIDGWGPWDTIVRRLTEADTIVVVDMPLWRHYLWATKRAVQDRRYPLIRLYKAMWWVNRVAMPNLRTSLAGQPAEKVRWLRTPADIRRFLEAAASVR